MPKDEEQNEVLDFISEQEDRRQPSSFKDFIIELLQVVIIALAIIIPVRYFFITPFYVKGASMVPTFSDSEYLVIDEISYRFKEPTRGEVVVFQYPRDPNQYFIKRIIGLPGETVQISDNEVFINGDELEEPYLDPGTETSNEIVVTLLPDEYFVLGDNRSFSLDSRSFGPLNEDHIVGRTWIRGWPFDKIMIFEPPQYSVSPQKEPEES